MKRILLLLIGIVFSFGISAQETNPNFNEKLALELGADDYGMKSYVLVLLKTGKNRSKDQNLINESFAGHFSNMNELAKQGKLVVAGPMGKNLKNYRGIFIFNVTTFEEATECLKGDLAVQNDFLQAELYQWYGSAALPVYLESEDKIWKKKF